MVKREFQKVPAMALACGLVLALILTGCLADAGNDNADDFPLELRGQVVEIISLQNNVALGSATHDPVGLTSDQRMVYSSIGVNGSIVDGRLEFISRGIIPVTDHLFSIGNWFEVVGEHVSNISDENTMVTHLDLWSELPEEMQDRGLVHGRIYMDYSSDYMSRLAIPIFADRPVSFTAFQDSFEFTMGWNILIFEYNLDGEGEILDSNVRIVDHDDPFLDLFQFVIWWMD